MPIRPENRARYPANWREISHRIRFDRAGGRCECNGECGYDHEQEDDGWSDRCWAFHGYPHHVTKSIVVLTVAHLDHQPENCDDDNLKAMCQRCHLAYDAPMHRAGRMDRARAKCASGDLFP